MNNNVNPGDRAIVVASSVPANVGLVVDVISLIDRPILVDDMIYNPKQADGATWLCESLGRPFSLRKMPELVELVALPAWAVLDKNLRRLDPLDEEPEARLVVAELPAGAA